MKLIDIGYGNTVASERIIAVCPPDSAPIKRLISESKENGTALDLTCGKRTKSVIILDNDMIVLCALDNEKVTNRVNGENTKEENDKGKEENE